MNNFSIIITAGGIGKRMGRELPKQFIVIADKPILIHTLEKIHRFDPTAQLLLTLPENWQSYWSELIEKFNCTIPHKVVDGGHERYHSVKNAIDQCTGNYIAIHDGVRPLISEDSYKRLKEAVLVAKAVIPVTSVKESLRSIKGKESIAENRTNFRLVQTPQFFAKDILQAAYSCVYHSAITDDASLVEESGFKISLIDGNEENIKITTPSDLLIAELLLTIEQKECDEI
jgi:2-C-methyl-D-erythritol 4-phosphate cytidylyltransferase